MADPPSGKPSARFSGETLEGQQDRTDFDPNAIIDADGPADREQTLADSDQTLSDADQTSADGDQTSADTDQLAADRDQAASDHDLAHGVDPRAYGVSHDARMRTSRLREQAAHDRDETARRRLEVADQRDVIADQRDAIADQRDRIAQRRDDHATARPLAMSEADAHEERHTAHGGASADHIVRDDGPQDRAAAGRAKAATYRELAAQDRHAAARDREQAARERLGAREDREALVVELRQERARRAEALRHQHHAERLARTLQHSLSPPSLPRIAGLDVAVHYEPFAPEEVGGDFYDLFPLGGHRSGFFLGDVCGKGPDAATVTSLARYTMRTAAMLHETPDAILDDLNSALHMETVESMQTCTAVYGQIDMSRDAATVILAVAGHPAPLVVRAGGGVETTPARGTLLGAVRHPVFQTCAVDLGPGDAIVVYSDGLLDTRIDGADVDERCLAEILTGTARASAAQLVDRLLRGVRRMDPPPRDDVAFLVLRRTAEA